MRGATPPEAGQVCEGKRVKGQVSGIKCEVLSARYDPAKGGKGVQGVVYIYIYAGLRFVLGSTPHVTSSDRVKGTGARMIQLGSTEICEDSRSLSYFY